MRSVETAHQITHKTRIILALSAIPLFMFAFIATDMLTQFLRANFAIFDYPRYMLHLWISSVLFPLLSLIAYQIAPPRSAARVFVMFFAIWHVLLTAFDYIATNYIWPQTEPQWPYAVILFSYAFLGIIHERDKILTTVEEKLDR